VSPFLNHSVVRGTSPESFAQQQPFPNFAFQDFLSADGFAQLNQAFPPLSAFEKHVGLVRANGQRSHDRYYLAYEESIYHRQDKGHYGLKGDTGTITHDALPEVWQSFMDELTQDGEYREFMEDMLGARGLDMRFAWHVGTVGSEVSPHRDALDKVGTHIFYFNTSADWQPEWGGSILSLGGKKVPQLNPDFEDFQTELAVDIRDNRSYLFKNTETAWHGVRALACPEGSYRRLFNVIFETPKVASRTARLRQRVRRWLG
jgi:hypothetical protein